MWHRAKGSLQYADSDNLKVNHNYSPTKGRKAGASATVRQASKGALYAYVITGGVTLAGLLTSSIFVIPDVSADNSAVDRVSVNVPSACTLGGVITEGDEHTATMVSGQYTQNIGLTTMTAFCNDPAGFTIYAAGASDGTVGDTASTQLISSAGAENNISTGIIDSTSNTSAWGMKLALVNASDTYKPTLSTFTTNADGYYAVPTHYTPVAYRESATEPAGEGAVGSRFTTTYAVYAKPNQAAGTYTGKVNYAMVHPYDSDRLTTLEVAFGNAGKTKVNVGGKNYYKMQDMTSEICDAVNIIGEVSQTQLVDTRDNNIYWATKLEDGHCWMTQSLDLNLAAGTPLTSENTNLKVASGNGYSTGYSESGGVITYTPSVSTTNSQNNNFSDWDDTQTNPKSWDTGVWYENGAYHNSATCNYLVNTCTYFSQEPFATNGTHGKVGNLYTWTQAIASNDSSALTTNTASDVSNNPQNSICPKGWRLPTVSTQDATKAGSTNEFARLNYIYNGGLTGTGDQGRDKGLFTAPLYFTRAGYVNSDALNSPGSSANYWSSTVYSGTGARGLYFYSTNVYPEYNGNRYYGFSVRCVAE